MTMTRSRTMYPQTLMLAKVLDALMKQPGIDTQEKAFDAMLHIIALDISYETMIQTPWLKEEVLKEVRDELDLDFLRSDAWDWLGEVYALRVNEEKYLIDRAAVEQYAAGLEIKLTPPKPFIMLDSAIGSGRLALAVSERIKAMGIKCPVLYYGMEPDLTAYRMTLLNFKLNGLEGRVLRANSDAYDTRIFSPNWKYANLWKPVEEKLLFTKEETDGIQFNASGDAPSVYYLQ